MSRVERFQSNRSLKRSNTNHQESYSEPIDPDDVMPPRKTLHPSNKGKLTRWFVNTLILLFILLVAGLLLWGHNLTSMDT